MICPLGSLCFKEKRGSHMGWLGDRRDGAIVVTHEVSGSCFSGQPSAGCPDLRNGREGQKPSLLQRVPWARDRGQVLARHLSTSWGRGGTEKDRDLPDVTQQGSIEARGECRGESRQEGFLWSEKLE